MAEESDLQMAASTPAERSLTGQIGAHESWAATTDRPARTSAGRAAFEKTFLDLAGGDPAAAEHLRKAYFLRLSLRSAQARRKARENTAAAEAAEAELDSLGGEA